MSKLKITGKELRAIGYPESPVINIAMNIMQKHYKFMDKEDAMALLKNILATPNEYKEDEVLGSIAEH